MLVEPGRGGGHAIRERHAIYGLRFKKKTRVFQRRGGGERNLLILSGALNNEVRRHVRDLHAEWMPFASERIEAVSLGVDCCVIVPARRSIGVVDAPAQIPFARFCVRHRRRDGVPFDILYNLRDALDDINLRERCRVEFGSLSTLRIDRRVFIRVTTIGFQD